MEKMNICLTITQIRSHVNFGNNLREAKAKKGKICFVTLKWHRLTCYVNWAILIGNLVDVTTLLLTFFSTSNIRNAWVSIMFRSHISTFNSHKSE